jgi:hypothetical protein
MELMPTVRTSEDQELMAESKNLLQSSTSSETVSIAGKGYTSRPCKCNDFNVNRFFGRDNSSDSLGERL